LIGRSSIGFSCMSCPQPRTVDVYVHAASQPVRRRKLTKIFTTIFHLISSLCWLRGTLPPAGASVSQLVLRKRQNEVSKNRRNSLHKGLLQTSVSLVLHTGLLPSPLISDALLFGRLWYGEPDAINNAIGYAKFFSRSHDAVIRVYDSAGNVIATYNHKGDFKEW
jgi:hypothetical protein